jgi:hypothetical protein
MKFCSNFGHKGGSKSGPDSESNLEEIDRTENHVVVFYQYALRKKCRVSELYSSNVPRTCTNKL